MLDVVEAEVHDEVDHGISEPLHALLHLKALGELVGIGAHAGSEGLDLDVGMVAEILARIKRPLLRLLHGFGEDAVVEGIGEGELVLGQVVGDILRHVEVEMLTGSLILHIREDHLATMADNGLDEHLLHLRGLLHGTGGGERLRLTGLAGLRTLLLALARLLALVDEAVHLGDERILAHVGPVGTLAEVTGADNGVADDGNAPDDLIDSLGAAHGVGDALQEGLGLEDDEVGTVLLDIGLEFLGGPAAGEVVGVLAVREEEHLDIHALGEQ